MASLGEPLNRSPFAGEQRDYSSHYAKSIPILPSITASGPHGSEPMDVSHQTAGSMAPPALGSPRSERPGEHSQATHNDQQHGQNHQNHQQHSSVNGGGQPVGAAAAAQQPKVVQTAFIHKLYNMLEDQGIQHLISWSGSNESFVMSPSSEFSKVLAQYFKHTNISSFVRQLNMYGFHKVSDVFHTGSPDSPLWEFKHGGGSFKRGDLVGLREIKRRASRHALIHRDSFPNAPKMPTPAPPGNAIETIQDPVDARLSMLEWNMNDAFTRLARSEDAYSALTTKCETLLAGLSRCHQWNQELSSHILTLVPDPDNPVHRQVYAMHQDIARQAEQLRSMEEPQDLLFSNKQSYFPTPNLPTEQAPPLSPRQRPLFDDSRRPSLQATLGRPSSFKSTMPAHLQVSPRRYGSIGTGSGTHSPLSTRPPHLPPPPPPPAPLQPQQHPLANAMTSPPPASLARRHTSADIRIHSWNGQPQQHGQGSSPYASGQSSAAWPSSPRATAQPGDQQLRDSLASYELSSHPPPNTNSRHPSPPPLHDTGAPSFASSFGGSYANPNDAGWQIPSARSFFKGLDTGPPTRRSSMASNVHSLLNPADTAEREGEDEGPIESAKRKRLQ